MDAPCPALWTTLRLWDLKIGAEHRHFKGHGRRVEAIAVLPDGTRALS